MRKSDFLPNFAPMKLKRLILLCVPMIAAAQAPADKFTAEIISNNPELRALRAAATAEILNRVADNRLEATEVGFAYKWPDKTDEVTKLEFEVSQAFDWPGAYGARRRATNAARRALTERAAADERALTLQVRTLLCTLVCDNRRVGMLSSIVANLDSLHVAMHRMLERGESTELDHRKLEIEEVAMKQQLAEATRSRTETLGTIAALNGGELPAGIADLHEYPAAELLPLSSYLANAAPEVAALNAQADVMTLDGRAERLGLLPGFSVGYVMEKEGPVMYNGFSLGLRLPEYSAKPRAEAARWEAAVLRVQAENADAQRRTQIAANHSAAEAAKHLLADYDHAFGNNYPALLHRALQGGAMTYIEYFSELNFYLSARLEYLQTEQTYQSLLQTLALQ